MDDSGTNQQAEVDGVAASTSSVCVSGTYGTMGDEGEWPIP